MFCRAADNKENLLDVASSNMTAYDASQGGETYLDDIKWRRVTLESQPVTSGDATLTFRAENGDKAVVKIYQSQYDN